MDLSRFDHPATYLQLVVLALAAHRLTRLIGWDSYPPVQRARERFLDRQSTTFAMHLLGCPWCIGWWVSLTSAATWTVSPHWTLLVAVPFAVSTIVGLIGEHEGPDQRARDTGLTAALLSPQPPPS